MSEVTNENTRKNRLQFLDMARGFALLLVMMGHCVSTKSFMHHFLFTFHVPMFFLIG